jgi:hypothetical protein
MTVPEQCQQAMEEIFTLIEEQKKVPAEIQRFQNWQLFYRAVAKLHHAQSNGIYSEHGTFKVECYLRELREKMFRQVTYDHKLMSCAFAIRDAIDGNYREARSNFFKAFQKHRVEALWYPFYLSASFAMDDLVIWADKVIGGENVSQADL